MQNVQKRKHTKVFSNTDQSEMFKATVSQFVDSRITASQNRKSYLTLRQIIDEFKKNGHVASSETIFFTELKDQLEHKHPTIIYKNSNGTRKYLGASFRD